MSPQDAIAAGRWPPCLVRCRSGGGRLAFILAALLPAFLAIQGCAAHKQVQYFAAKDPETGVTNYYRMSICGWGAFGTDYHLQAGYFSAASVDVLRGSMPEIPILDLPVEQLEVFDRLTQQFYAALIQEAKRAAPVKDLEAMIVATESRKGVAEHRLGKLETELAHYERLRSGAETDRDAKKTVLDQKKTTSDDAETKLGAAKTSRDLARSAVSTAEAELLSKEGAEATAISESARSEDEVKRAKASWDAAKEDAKKAKAKMAAETRPAEKEALKKECDRLEQEAKSKEDEHTAKKKASAEAKTKADQAVTERKKVEDDRNGKIGLFGAAEAQVNPLRAKAYIARVEYRQAQRDYNSSLRKWQTREKKVDSIEVDIKLRAAARDAANRLLEKLGELTDGASIGELAAGVEVDPFKPIFDS